MTELEKKNEIIRLTKRLCAVNPGAPMRFKELSCFDSAAGITVRLFLPTLAARRRRLALVYSRERDYDAERVSHNREFGKLGIYSKGSAHIFKEGAWEPEFADMTLSLLREALVLDLLVDL